MSCTVAWWTDPHFELLFESQQEQLLRAWSELSCDAVVVTGDISHGTTTLGWLRRLADVFPRPIYFVLGNHDYYGTSIARQRLAIQQLCGDVQNLHFLTSLQGISLTSAVVLIGHDGWGDMREGDWEHTTVRPPDFDEIEELKQAAGDRAVVRATLQRLGDEAAAHFARLLPNALERHPQVVVATHVPPFREASWYEGQNSSAPWLPFFCCHAAGVVLVELAERFPQRQLLVLCGHCHGSGDVRIRENLRVITGGGEPCSPQVQRVLEFA